MTVLKGSKKEGVKLTFTKTWGFHIVDYVNLSNDGRPVQTNYSSYEVAEVVFNQILQQKNKK
jgi:hypothetical protein